MLFISPPFGNYIHLPNTMSIKGSYTLEPRSGLILQIMKTLRFINYNGTYMFGLIKLNDYVILVSIMDWSQTL